jgi:hypothetical protein
MTAMNRFRRRRIYKENTPDPRIMRGCPQRKLGYQTKAVAKSAAAKGLRFGALPLYPYKCPYCKYWHLTEQVQG